MDSSSRDRIERRNRRRADAGQASIVVVLMLSLFLLAALAFAVDYTNIWFQRQQVQTAADAACQAGAMDMYFVAAGQTLSNMGFTYASGTIATGGNCNSYSAPGPTMCWYASKNGFNGYSGGNATVSWSFPTSVPGASATASSVTKSPFMQVSVSQPVKTYFSTLLTGSQTQQVSASTTCGLVQQLGAAPLTVLNPTVSGAVSLGSSAVIKIVGGPPRAIVVDSSSSSAVFFGSSSFINTSKGGPLYTGSDVAVVGAQAAPGSAYYNFGIGSWTAPASPVIDPYAGVAAPASVKSIVPVTGTSGKTVAHNIDGCPVTSCTEFAPGYYPWPGISLGSSVVAIFLPGTYYMDSSITAGSSASLRMAKRCATSQGVISGTLYCNNTITFTPNWTVSAGLMFYFHSGTMSFGSSSGGTGGMDTVPSTDLTCDGSNPDPTGKLGLPASLGGNVLVGQCTKNGSYYDAGGDTTDSAGNTRGLIYFADHGNATALSFGSSATLSFSGAMYLHALGNNDNLTLGSSSANGTFVIGKIVTDTLTIGSAATVNMALTPASDTPMIKVALLQ
jgi:hypothetical protein